MWFHDELVLLFIFVKIPFVLLSLSVSRIELLLHVCCCQVVIFNKSFFFNPLIIGIQACGLKIHCEAATLTTRIKLKWQLTVPCNLLSPAEKTGALTPCA